MKQKYIFFDLDGTLTDPAEGILNCIEHSIKKLGLFAKREELKCFIGPPLLDTYMKFFNIPRETAEKAVEYYRERFSVTGLFENKLYAGIPEALKRLKDSGKHLVIATSKPEIYTKRITDHFGITEYFDFIAGALLDHSRVEKADVIAHAVRELSADVEGSVMIGDRKFDIEGAAENGIKGYGVLWGYGSQKELALSGAEKCFETVSEMTDFLIEL